MKATCTDDTCRPNEIPISHWVKKGEEYTITDAIKCNVQGGLLGYRIAEIDLSGFEPMTYFRADRFDITMGLINFLTEQQEIEYNGRK